MSSVALFQDLPPAQGTPGTNATQQSEPPAGGEAQPAGTFSLLFPLLLFVPLILLLFFSSRSQQKKQQAAISSLKKGDRVLTQAGLVGKLIEIGDRYAKIEIAPGVKVELLKSGLLGKDTVETAAAVEKK